MKFAQYSIIFSIFLIFTSCAKKKPLIKPTTQKIQTKNGISFAYKKLDRSIIKYYFNQQKPPLNSTGIQFSIYNNSDSHLIFDGNKHKMVLCNKQCFHSFIITSTKSLIERLGWGVVASTSFISLPFTTAFSYYMATITLAAGNIPLSILTAAIAIVPVTTGIYSSVKAIERHKATTLDQQKIAMFNQQVIDTQTIKIIPPGSTLHAMFFINNENIKEHIPAISLTNKKSKEQFDFHLLLK